MMFKWMYAVKSVGFWGVSFLMSDWVAVGNGGRSAPSIAL